MSSFLFLNTNHCLSVSIPKTVQIVAIGWVHPVLHDTGQFSFSRPGEVSLKQDKSVTFNSSRCFFIGLFDGLSAVL